MLTAIIQARMNSSRLPGKVMMNINGKPMLYHVIKQTLYSKKIDNVIVATTNSKNDKIIVNYCREHNHDYFCGSTNDVLDRYYQCAKKFNYDPVIRISADSPLIDPQIIDRVLQKFLNNSYDYVSNNIEKIKNKWVDSTCNFPIGTVIEVSTFNALKSAWKKSKLYSEREHVFPYIQTHPELFTVSNIKIRKNLSHIRITVDKKNDLKFVRKIFTNFSNNKQKITIADIEKLVNLQPEIIKINNNTAFDEGHKKSISHNKKIH